MALAWRFSRRRVALRMAIAQVAVTCGLAGIWSEAAQAQSGIFERLVMPGEVIAGHADIEGQCRKCHEPFSRGAQGKLCTACHKGVGADVAAGKGYHGRRKEAREGECKHCHTEHKGRKVDIVRLDPDTFQHGATDFPLRGAHTKVRCASCHAAGKKHRDAPSRCIDCHRKDDRHNGSLGPDCAKCHSEQAWRGGKFDHGKTRFPLVGRHEQAACASCHAKERYKGTPLQCVECHRLDDAHGGRYGRKCETCHSPRGWKQIAFDHDRQTRFPLTGRHRQAKCDSCHKGAIYETKLKQDCFACHEKDDAHRGRNGKACQSCHSTAGWREVRFDHDKDTKFPLRGRHAAVKCESCHRGGVRAEKLDTACASCHKVDDVHRGQLGPQCSRCHNETGWRAKVKFDHDLTRFPLIGLHATAPCEACHTTAAYKETPTACVACHKRNDTHEGRLGPSCGQCHNPNGWALWRFDHNRQTRYPLDGAHAGLHCDSCHRRAVTTRISLSTACVDCHRKDDAHRGGFGTFCEQCHVTESFAKVRQFR